MNLRRIYDQLIAKRKATPPDGYSELHHIIPKSMGGEDAAHNTVRLSAREHYVAHWILWRIHRTPAMAHAFWTMARKSDDQGRVITSAMYARARTAHVEALKSKTGDKNHFYGKTHSEETKRLISEKAKARGRAVWDVRGDESKARYMAAVRKPKTAEHRAKIGVKGLIMLKSLLTGEIIRVPADFDCGDEWVNPRKITPEKKFKCEHCDMVTTPSMLKRWHNDNCKRKNHENQVDQENRPATGL